MDYVPYMRHLMTAPLVSEGISGVDQTVSLLHAYDLLREDFDSVLEVSSWSSTQDVMSHVDSKVSCCSLIFDCQTYHFDIYCGFCDGFVASLLYELFTSWCFAITSH